MLTPRDVLRCALLAATLVGLNACGGAEARKAGFIERGRTFLAEANYDKARVEFSNALQVDPNDAQARYLSGVVAEKLGNPRDAVGHYQAAIERDPALSDARAALGRLYLFAGLSEKALELVGPSLEKTPDSAPLLVVRGGALGQKGEVDAALRDGERAVQLAPKDEYAVALLASLYRGQGRANEAAHALREGIGRMPRTTDLRVALAELELSEKRPAEAERLLREVIGIDPDAAMHRFRLARLQLALGRSEDAEKTLRETIRLRPQDDAAKIAMVEMLAASRGEQTARAEIENMLRGDDVAGTTRVALGEQLVKLGAAERAEAVFREVSAAEDLKPAGLVARTRLATLVADRGDAQAALRLLEEVLKASPRDADALALRGNLALIRGDVQGAITDLRSVLRDQPGSVAVLRTLAQAHRRNGETGLAEEALRTAVQSNPSDREARLELAQLLALNGKLEQAVPLLDQLGKEAPADIRVQDTMFRVRIAQRDWAGARAVADGLRQSHPDAPAGHYFAGLVDEAEGRTQDAVANYEAAVRSPIFALEPLAALVRLDITGKRADRAVARLREVVKKRADDAALQNLLGDALLSAKSAAEADEAYANAIRLAPKWWAPYRGRALAQLAGGNESQAIATLTAGIKGAAEPQALAADLATIHERNGRPQDAIAVYEAELKRDPKSVFAANNLAMLLVTHAADAAALQRAGKLADGVLAGANDAAVLDTRGWVKYKLGAHEEARKLLQRASDAAPDSPLIRYHLAMTQLKLGDRDAAKRNLQAAVAAKRPFSGIDDAKSRLAELERAG